MADAGFWHLVCCCVRPCSIEQIVQSTSTRANSLCSSLSSVCVSVMSGCDATREDGEGDAMNLDGHFTLHVRRYAYRTELSHVCVLFRLKYDFYVRYARASAGLYRLVLRAPYFTRRRVRVMIPSSGFYTVG